MIFFMTTAFQAANTWLELELLITMNKLLSAILLPLFAASGLAAADAFTDVKVAAKKLADQPNYSWTSTPKSEPELPNLRLGPTEARTEKGGYTHATLTYNDTEVELAFKGDKGAIKLEGEWNSESDLEGDRAWIAQRLKAYKAAAAEAEALAGQAKTLKRGDAGLVSGDLTEEAVKEILGRINRRAATDAKEAKGWVKFWIKDGLLTKYEFNVSAEVTVREEDLKVNLTTTVEIKAVGKTKVSVPDEAKKKLS
jgi:hypothetical protein